MTNKVADTRGIRERAKDEARKAVEAITNDMLTRHKMGYCWPGTEPMMALLAPAMAAFAESELASERERERQRAVEICDLTLERMIDRDACARAIRNPETKYPSMARARQEGS